MTRDHSQRAFTFIEIIASLAILEVIVMTILGMFLLCQRSTAVQRDRLIVSNLFQWKMEEIRLHDFLKDETNNGIYLGPQPYVVDTTQITNYLGNPKLKRVDVIVQWTNAWSADSEQVLSILKADH